MLMDGTWNTYFHEMECVVRRPARKTWPSTKNVAIMDKNVATVHDFFKKKGAVTFFFSLFSYFIEVTIT